MLKLLFLVSFLLISDITKVSSLQCYSCENCATVNANTAMETCGATTTTTSGSITTPTGESSTTSTTESSTTPQTSTSSTTTTTSGSITTPTGESSTTSTTESSTTPQTSTSSTQTSTSSTQTSSSSTQATSSTPTSTTTATSSGSTDANNRYSDSPVESIDGDSKVYSKDFQVIRARRKVSRAESTVDYVCVIVTGKENGTDLTYRGCAPISGDKDGCTIVQEHFTNVSCHSCNTDKCNSAAALEMSLFLLLIVTFARFALSK